MNVDKVQLQYGRRGDQKYRLAPGYVQLVGEDGTEIKSCTRVIVEINGASDTVRVLLLEELAKDASGKTIRKDGRGVTVIHRSEDADDAILDSAAATCQEIETRCGAPKPCVIHDDDPFGG